MILPAVPSSGGSVNEEESSSFAPPTSTHDTIREQRLIANRFGLIDRNTTQPRDEERGFPQSQADAEATTTATHVVHLDEHNWQRRLKTNMRRLKANVNVRDVVAGLQILTLVALIILLLMTSHSVGSMNMKLLSERNEDELNEALVSITSMTKNIENVTRRVQTVADDVADFSGSNVTQDDVQQGLNSAVKIVESIGSVAEEVNHYTRKQTTQDDFDDVLRKLGRLVDKGLDEFE